MKRTGILFLLAAAIPALAQKRSMAIEAFDYSAVMTAVQSIFGTHVNIGQGISAMLVKRVSQDGKFTVVERNKVGSVLREQDFGASGRVKKGTAARTGQIRGAELTMMGDIVVFGRDDRRSSAGAGAIVRGTGAAIGGYKSEGKAVVVLNYRLVDNETTEIVASGEARGESKRSSKGGGAAFLTGGVFAGAHFDMASSNFAETIIGEAVMDACDKLAVDISGQAGRAGTRQVEIEARVADVNGGTLIINAGSSAGVQSGDRLEVHRISKQIKDPATGEVLDTLSEKIGDLVITQVREKISTGAYTGSTPAKVGDIARK